MKCCFPANSRQSKGSGAGYVRWRRALVGALLVTVSAWCGCITVPQSHDMLALRAHRADTRLRHLAAKTATNDVCCYLSGPLPLADAVEEALALNLWLRQARLEQEIARARILASYTEVLPLVDLAGGYVRTDQEQGAARSQDRYNAGLRLRQPLFSGRMMPALRSGRLYEFWADTGIREAEENVRYEVIAAYYTAVLSEHLLSVNLVSLETAQRQRADTQARRRQGMASNYDELRAEVEVSNFQAQVLQAQNNKDVARTKLFRLLGVSPESDVVLSDALPLVIESVTFERAVRVALERRADLFQAEYVVQLQREGLKVAQSRYWPEISAYLAQDWAKPEYQSGKKVWADEWQAGIQLNLPLFDGFDRRSRVVQEQAKLLQAELALRDLEDLTVSEVRQRVLSLKTAEEFARSQNRNLDTAKEALRLVATGLKEGQNTPVEVMDARQALTTASANYYQSLYDHAMSRVALQKAMGLLSEGLLPHAAVFKIEEENINE